MITAAKLNMIILSLIKKDLFLSELDFGMIPFHRDSHVCLITEQRITSLVLLLLVAPLLVESCRQVSSSHIRCIKVVIHLLPLHPLNSRASFLHPHPSTQSLQAGLLLQRRVHQVSTKRGHHLLSAAGRGHDPLCPGRGT